MFQTFGTHNIIISKVTSAEMYLFPISSASSKGCLVKNALGFKSTVTPKVHGV